MPDVTTFMFEDDGKIPNHPTLPLVVYKDVIQGGASACRAMYERNQWNDFQIMGAYPMGQTWDLCRGESCERPRVLDNIKHVPLPKTDPVQGVDGMLLDIWS